MTMKRQNASNIYFTVTHFTIQCTCHEKIYIFTFEVKIDHQLIFSPGPLLQKLEWLFPLVAHLNILFVLKTKRMSVLKKRVHLVLNVGAAEALTQIALKQSKNNTSQLIQSSIMGLLDELFHSQGRGP